MHGLNTKHPGLEKLAAFGLGRLSDADSEVIELHLADCDDCRKQVEDVPDDSLVSLLQVSAAESCAEPAASADTASSLSQESVAPLYQMPAQIISGDPAKAPAAPPSPT